MVVLVKIINAIFDLFFFPFRAFPPLWGLIAMSVITGIVMLIIFRRTSNQKAIKEAKDKLKAYLLELLLYKDNLRVIIKAIGNIFRYNFAYLKQTIIPLLFIIIPVIVILIQLNFRYQYREISPEESFIVKMKLKPQAPFTEEVVLQGTEHVIVETPVLRIPETGEYNWRARLALPGETSLKFLVEKQSLEKRINADKKLAMLSPAKVEPSLFRMLFNPAEEPLPRASIVESIEISYPTDRLNILGARVHWLVVFFVVSLIAAFALKGVFKVEL